MSDKQFAIITSLLLQILRALKGKKYCDEFKDELSRQIKREFGDEP